MAIKIAIIVNKGDIKKLFINSQKISEFDIPSDKLDEERLFLFLEEIISFQALLANKVPINKKVQLDAIFDFIQWLVFVKNQYRKRNKTYLYVNCQAAWNNCISLWDFTNLLIIPRNCRQDSNR